MLRIPRPLRLALLAASTGGAVALFLRQAHPARLASSLAGLPPGAVAAAVAATLGGVALAAVRWRLLLAAGGVEAAAPRLFAALTIGAVPGARLGAGIALGAQERTLRLVVGLFLLAVALWYAAVQALAMIGD